MNHIDSTPSHTTASEAAKLAESAWFAVVRAYQVCSRRYEQLLGRVDLTIAQYDALSAIQRLGSDAQPKRIAEHLLVTRGNVTGLLNRLADRGLLTMHPHPDDGRSRIARVTPAGVDMLTRARPLARAFIRAQMEPFMPSELTSTRDLMQRMEKHLEELDPEAVHSTVESHETAAPRQARLI